MVFEAVTGIGLLGILQDIRGSAPDFFVSLFTLTSDLIVYQYVPIAIAAFLLWFVDRRKGEFILLNMIVALNFAELIKNLVKQPRPWVLDTSLENVEESAYGYGYSFPSGHSTTATSGYGSLAYLYRGRWASYLFVAVAILVMFGRLYLGAHTPLDIAVGCLLALLVIYLNIKVLRWSYLSDDNYRIASYGYMIVLLPVCIVMAMISIKDPGINALAIALTYGFLVGRHIEHFYLRSPETRCSAMHMTALYVLGMIPVVICLLVLPKVLGPVPGYAVGGAFTGLWLTLLYPLAMQRAMSGGRISE